MGGWRRRPCRCTRKLLVAAMLLLGAVGLVVVLHRTDEQKAARYTTAARDDRLMWPDNFLKDASTPATSYSGPGIVVLRAGKSEGLLERFLKSRSTSGEIISLDMTRPASSNAHCLHTKTEPSYPVCPHPVTLDRHISNQLKTEGCWQPRTLALLPVALHSYPSSTLVDIGAHIGVFSLFGAHLGASVVAVEPVYSSAVHLHAGAAAGDVSGRVTILLHAVTREPAQVKLKYKNGNLGGTSVVEVTPQEAESIRNSHPHEVVTSVTLDTLAPFINTSVVILKIDMEGRECQAISGGRELLTARFTPYIFMEWAVLANNKHKFSAPCRPHHLQEMVQWLSSRGYKPYISKSGAPLNPDKVDSWRAGDIYWRHSKAPPLHLFVS